MSKIKLLSDDLINQIAAGEIVERPAAALKEIVENSIDARAKNIEIFIQNGGKTKIVVQDDGEGLSQDDLLLAIERHATSKLSDENLFDIRSYGFRGEAIPSIASVSDFSIESRSFGIAVNFSEKSEIFPSQVEIGTRVTIRNLFDKMPARLKFQKSDSVELTNCLTVIENISLIKKNVNFSLRSEDRVILSFKNDSLESRISKILGNDLFKKAIFFEENDDNISISGYLFHPMDSRYSQAFQKVFINGRVVKDRIVSSSIKNAYKDLIPTGRFAVSVIFIEIDPFHIDVNVSPTKSEIRFRDASFVQKFLTSSIKKNLTKFDRVVVDVDISRISGFENTIKNQDDSIFEKSKNLNLNDKYEIPTRLSENDSSLFKKAIEDKIMETSRITEPSMILESGVSNQIPIIESKETERFFGEPLAQVFDSYILTKTKTGIMIIDQHAVHEKITQDKMIKNLSCNNKQFLMKPEVLELSDSESKIASSVLKSLRDCGFALDLVKNSLIISAIPSIINPKESVEFIRDMLMSFESIENLEALDIIKHKIADKACHNSIRFGRKLSHEEMISILEQMEDVPSIHQCNHHRPSFVELSKDQLEKMFNRS